MEGNGKGAGNVPTRNLFRHGRWRDFQFSQALRKGVNGFGDVMVSLRWCTFAQAKELVQAGGEVPPSSFELTLDFFLAKRLVS